MGESGVKKQGILIFTLPSYCILVGTPLYPKDTGQCIFFWRTHIL